MKLKDFLKKNRTGMEVEYDTAIGKDGKVIIAISKDGERFVLESSLKNFSRFKDWVGSSSTADIKLTGKYHKTKDYGSLPIINIRTNISSEIKDEDDKEKEEVF